MESSREKDERYLNGHSIAGREDQSEGLCMGNQRLDDSENPASQRTSNDSSPSTASPSRGLLPNQIVVKSEPEVLKTLPHLVQYQSNKSINLGLALHRFSLFVAGSCGL